jgi:hypothetical protein
MMKHLITLPFSLVLLMACGPTTTDSEPDEEEFIDTAESGLCGCPSGQVISYYYCASWATSSCGVCSPYNAHSCSTIPASGNYTQCGAACAAGFYTTVYATHTDCSSSGAPAMSVQCFKPNNTTIQFTVCGNLCPDGYDKSVPASGPYSENCDTGCAVGSCDPTKPENIMTCTKK